MSLYGLKLPAGSIDKLEEAAWGIANTFEEKNLPPEPKEVEARMVLTTRMVESIFMFGEINLGRLADLGEDGTL